MTHQMVQQKDFPLLLTQVHCYNQYQNHRSHTLIILPTFIEETKVKKLNVSFFGLINAYM